MADKVESRRRSGRPGFIDRASEQPAHASPTNDRLLVERDGWDHARCDGAVGEPRGPDSSVTAKRAEIRRRYDRAERQAATGLQRTTSWPDISRNKRRKELRVLRNIWTERGRSTVEIDKAINENGWPHLNGRDLGACPSIEGILLAKDERVGFHLAA
jgi:hypothetical protein